MGVPCTAPIDHTILESLTSAPGFLPTVLKRQLHVAYIASQIAKALGDSEVSPSGALSNPISMVRSFERDLGLVETMYQSSWSPPEEVRFLGVRLMLYYFILTSTGDKIRPADHNLDEFLPAATTVAQKIVHIAASVPGGAHLWSIHAKECVIATAFFLLILKDSNHPSVDLSSTRAAISQAWTTLHDCILSEHEYLARGCIIISWVSRHGLKREGNGFSLKVKSRMLANLIWDLIWRMRDELSVARAHSLAERLQATDENVTTSEADPNGQEAAQFDGMIDDAALGFGAGDLIDWESLFDDYGHFSVPPEDPSLLAPVLGQQ